jgi:hypothetical protein
MYSLRWVQGNVDAAIGYGSGAECAGDQSVNRSQPRESNAETPEEYDEYTNNQ